MLDDDLNEEYEGYPVIETAIIINKTGDGLSAAMNIEPVSIAPDQRGTIILTYRKTKDRYDFIRDPKSGKILGVKWIQILDATGATFTNSTTAKKEVDKMADKIAEFKANAKGQLTMIVGEADEPTRAKHPDLADEVDKALGE